VAVCEVYDKVIKLGVNIDHAATLRQARKEGIPDILRVANAAAAGGADCITIHLRQDRRHIQDEDVYRLKNEGPLPINLEMAAVEEIEKIALDVKPASACLVPEKREELTTEGGLDVAGNLDRIKKTTAALKAAGIEVSLFIDPEKEQIAASAEAGADAIELHTGRYANSKGAKQQEELLILKEGVKYGLEKGLKVNAGHGLDYENVMSVKGIEGISDLNIGYSIICQSIFVGIEQAVKQMKALLV
jgi:pyridoxine 5-phosphate synthase